jgi:flagellar biosynthesis protein
MSDRQVAVALKYLRARSRAPQVVAKGRGSVAERIVEIARRKGIPVHRDSDLAEVLVKLELDDWIPPELYKAVAEVLAYLYRMNGVYTCI